MRKLNTPFSVSTYPRGSNMGTVVWSYPKPLSTIWYDNGDIYFEEGEIDCIRKFLEYRYYKDKNYPHKISDNIFEIVENIKKQSINIDSVDGLEKLIKALEAESKHFFKLIGYISYRGAVQMCDVLEEKMYNVINFKLLELNISTQAKDILASLSIPLYQSIIMEEKKDSLKLSKEFSILSGKKQENIISKYIEKYEWLSYHWLVGKPLEREDVKDKILLQQKTSQNELKK